MGEPLEDLLTLLAPGGRLSQCLDRFEQRPQQVEMALAVDRCFARDLVLLVEAGTGVGKSLAYGLPAGRHALATGQRVVISTGTINLQEQLVGKDLPLVNAVLRGGLRIELQKGRANFLCKRRLHERRRQRELIEPGPEQSALDALEGFAQTSGCGSRSDLPGPVPEDVWELVQADADACLGARCPFRDECFFLRARARAAEADILVVNHHLLFADLSVRLGTENWEQRAVLPPFDRLIIDEGHTLEDVATGFFGFRLSRSGLLRTLGRLLPLGRRTGLLSGLATRSALARRVVEVRSAFERALDGLLVLTGPARDRTVRLTPEIRTADVWTAAHEGLGQVERGIRGLAGALSAEVERIELLGGSESLAVELGAVIRRLEAALGAIARWLSEEEDGDVRWLEGAGAGSGLTLSEAPLDVAEQLNQALFEPMRSVVITSATLSVGADFSYLSDRLGLGALGPRLETLRLDSPFDYQRQALLVAIRNAPQPTDPAFASWLPGALVRLLAASRGGALCLFTAWNLMTRAFASAREQLEERGIEPLCQGQAPRDRLLQRLRESGSAALFGTDSFWQGVDVAGKALRQVIITRLPFEVPTEPLAAARAERLEALGRDPFLELSLPRAVLRLKQGFGRLIRSGQDCGAVVVLDERLLSRRYGRRFLKSLPPARLLEADLEEALSALGAFFASADPGAGVSP